MSNKSKISAAEKEICFEFIQSHLGAGSSKSTRSKDSDSEPATTDDAPCKDQGTLLSCLFPCYKKFRSFFFSMLISFSVSCRLSLSPFLIVAGDSQNLLTNMLQVTQSLKGSSLRKAILKVSIPQSVASQMSSLPSSMNLFPI